VPAVRLEPTPAEAGLTSGTLSRPEPINVNRAGSGQLMRKLKLDARRARYIVEFRRIYGRFRRPEDLAQVSGITDELVRRWEEQDILRFE
jgi:DNA uptake protein ComE-like DNA-binding protein